MAFFWHTVLSMKYLSRILPAFFTTSMFCNDFLFYAFLKMGNWKGYSSAFQLYFYLLSQLREKACKGVWDAWLLLLSSVLCSIGGSLVHLQQLGVLSVWWEFKSSPLCGALLDHASRCTAVHSTKWGWCCSFFSRSDCLHGYWSLLAGISGHFRLLPPCNIRKSGTQSSLIYVFKFF